MRAKPWDVSDALWERIEPLLPRRRLLHEPGRAVPSSRARRKLELQVTGARARLSLEQRLRRA